MDRDAIGIIPEVVETKIRVLIAGHIGFPVGGVSKNYEELLKSKLMDIFKVSFVETSSGNLKFSERGSNTLSNYFNALLNIFYFTKSLIINRPQLVDIGTADGYSLLKHSFMGWLAHVYGAKVVFQFHFSFSRFLTSGIVGKIIMMLLSVADGFEILSSEWDDLETIFPDKQIAYIPNAIDISKHGKHNRKSLEDRSRVNVLYLGHLGVQKGTFDLLEAIEKIRNLSTKFSLNIYGEGIEADDFSNLQKSIIEKKLSDVVSINPPIFDEQKIMVLNQSDVLVLPSYHEGMPISIIEAMASGLAVIASNVGGIKDQVLHGHTGFLIEPKDINQLAFYLNRLILDGELRTRMGVDGQKRAAQLFDISVKVRTLSKFYNSICWG